MNKLQWENLPDLVTPKEARAYLRFGRSKMYELLRTKQIGYIRKGSCYLIPKPELTAYVERELENGPRS
ncbi:helix-turn-helix domain-containing protein [Ruminococcaceae bacterium OttesenSCG-928-D13]|nr:helix-turn-helix domain-containing protein [Ruminococcaceae bacterium OttesenSCG-928-D13]